MARMAAAAAWGLGKASLIGTLVRVRRVRLGAHIRKESKVLRLQVGCQICKSVNQSMRLCLLHLSLPDDLTNLLDLGKMASHGEAKESSEQASKFR